MQTVIIIPSRWESSRFPGKPLAAIKGVPMIIRVCDRASQAGNVCVATDDERIYDAVESNGYKAIMTGECSTGTDRVYQAARKIKADIYVNVQGDEPLVNPEDIREVIRMKKLCPSYVIGSVAKLKASEENNENIVKVLIDGNMNMLEMSRQSIHTPWRQCGIYAYTLKELKQFAKSRQREIESIELTRIRKVKFAIIKGVPAVDVPEDIKRIEALC